MRQNVPTRGERLALLLQLAVLVALVIALLRVSLAFRHLCQRQDVSIGQYFYFPLAFVVGMGLAVRSIWRTSKKLLAARGVDRSAESRDNSDP